MSKHSYKNLKTTAKADSEIVIEGEIPSEILDEKHKKAYQASKEKLEVPGFRAGKAPDHLIKANISELRLLDAAAEEVFREEYPKMIEHLELFPVDRPKIEIMRLAAGNPLGFKITVPVMPKIDLPDYKKTAAAENKKIKPFENATPVTEKEIDDTIEEIKKTWAHQEYHRQNPGGKHEHGESFDHLLPTIDDVFVKNLGDFKDVADFRAKIKENISKEKLAKEKDKRRVALLDALLNEFKIELPKVFVESELDKMISELNNRVSSSGIKPANYYKQISKTEADIRNEWRLEAVKRVKLEIFLSEIAKKESIAAEKEAVDAETKQLVAYYKDTDPARARSYVEHILTNDKVLAFLENL